MDDFVSVLFELCTNTYRFQSRYDAVIDIGGFLGESAWWFLTEGLAKRVIVYEPVYYEMCQRNLSSIAEVYPYAIYKEKTTIEMAIQGKVSTALNDRNEKLISNVLYVRTTTFEDVLNEASQRFERIALKIDCEGCEQYLADVPCYVLRKAQEYIIEIHRSVVNKETLIKHFKQCGFRVYAKPVILHAIKLG